jgi:hypothetical protein
MSRKPSGFGFVMLLVVLAIVLWVAARGWEGSGAAALALDPQAATPARQGARDAREAAADLPDLHDMRDATADHADAVREALEATEE